MDKYIGKRLDGRYEIKEILGVGGMANVYKAYDLLEDKVVSIKILRDEFLSNDEFTRRFKNESKAIALLSHPNIVKVYDVSFSDKIQSIVMEYIDGITLKEYIDEKKVLTWKEAIHYTVQILRALQHAHDKGIVHRDIKPQNVMLLQDGTIKVMDFGIARFSRSQTKTITDKAIGSVHYISPEQATGGVTDEKADIYSVGVMIFEMLTGNLPFEADSAISVALMQLQTDPKKPRSINQSIPEGLEEITLKAMQKDPLKRYQSAAEMLRDIEEFKRNPSIQFEYKYFVDENPTKFIDPIKEPLVAAGIVNGVEEEPVEEEKSSLIPILAGVAAAFVVVAILFVVGMLIFSPFNNTKKNIILPNFAGMNIDEAKAKNKLLDIVVENHEYSDKYDKDQITSQNPAAGKSVKSDTIVKVILSLGKKVVIIPDVYGQDLLSAQTTLTNAGFTYREVKQPSLDVTKDFVIKTKPARTTEAAYGSEVTIYVSMGKETTTEIVRVPTLTGLTKSNAIAEIERVGLKLGNVTTKDDIKAKDTVLSQVQAVGSLVAKGSEIDITVSTGLVEATIDIPLPDITYGVTIEIYVEGESVYSKRLIPSVSKKITFTSKGTGTKSVEVRIENKIYLKYSLNYTTGESNVTFGTPGEFTMPVSSTSSSSSASTTSAATSKATTSSTPN